MIRMFWVEYQSALKLLEFICQFCEYLASDLSRLQTIKATKADIEDILKRYREFERLASDLDRKIQSLTRYTSHWLNLERLPLIGDVWRIQLTKNLWLTQRQETNRIYFAAQRKMLTMMPAFRQFLYDYQDIIFPVTHVHIMSDYEKLLYDFKRGELDLSRFTKARE